MIRTLIVVVALLAPLAPRAEEQESSPPHAAEPAASTPIDLAAPAAPAPAGKHGFFPIWGDKVRAKGFDLPEPFAVMVNYYFQQSDIKISNLQLGVNGGQKVDVSDLIKIPEATTRASALAIRPSLMVLPFFSVYAVYSSGATETNIHMTDPIDFRTTAKSGAQVLALGGTFQMGYKGFFGVADFNGAVSDVERLADTVGANMLSFRAGYNFKLNDSGRGVSVWAGTAGQVLEVATQGSVRLADVLPPPTQGMVDRAQARCDAIPPTDAVRKRGCNNVVQKFRDWADGTDPTATVDYSLDKKPAGIWNMLLGAQYAMDRNWWFRVEVSFLAGRTSFLAGTEYRFDIL